MLVSLPPSSHIFFSSNIFSCAVVDMNFLQYCFFSFTLLFFFLFRFLSFDWCWLHSMPRCPRWRVWTFSTRFQAPQGGDQSSPDIRTSQQSERNWVTSRQHSLTLYFCYFLLCSTGSLLVVSLSLCLSSPLISLTIPLLLLTTRRFVSERICWRGNTRGSPFAGFLRLPSHISRTTRIHGGDQCSKTSQLSPMLFASYQIVFFLL